MHDYFFKANALANSYPPMLLGDYIRIEQTISAQFKWYLLGLTYSCVDYKSFETYELNTNMTRAQLSQNSGCAEGTLRRFKYYMNAIGQIQKSLPELASRILAGDTRLGLKTTFVLVKLPPHEITLIMDRAEIENAPIRAIIAEQSNPPLTYTQRFSDGCSTKNSPKSVKDIPRYDPDAHVAGLTYTIPSWVKAISRLQVANNLYEISDSAREKLGNELMNLNNAIESIINKMLEVER